MSRGRISLWLVLTIVGALAAVGLARLRFDTEILSLLPSDLPSVRALGLQQLHFASAGELFITVRGETPEIVEDACRSLAEMVRAETDLVRWALWAPPWLEHPELAAELLATAWLNGPAEATQDLIGRLAPDRLHDHLEAVRTRLSTSLSPAEIAEGGYDPLGLLRAPGLSDFRPESGPRFSSEDGTLRMVVVTFRNGGGGYQEATQGLERIRTVVARWRSRAPEHAGLAIAYTGGPVFAAEMAQGMERDMRNSVLGTAAIITLLFFWAHRRFRPLLILIALLALTLLSALAAGGLIFGRLNAVSLGFAAVLLGLAVDYGLVLYQESVLHPQKAFAEIRRIAGPSITWSSITTAAAFGALALGGLPGLTQLGTLVACGTLAGAIIMLRLFLSPLLGTIRAQPRQSWWLPDRAALVLTPALGGLAFLALTWQGLPIIDSSAELLRPRHSEALAAMEAMRPLLEDTPGETWWIVAAGPDEASVASQLRTAEVVLSGNSNDPSSSLKHQLPTALWPDPGSQEKNRPALASLAAERGRLREALHASGFTDEAFQMATLVFDAWGRAGANDAIFWPTNEVSDWTLAQVAVRGPRNHSASAVSGNRFFALGSVHPGLAHGAGVPLQQLRDRGLSVGSWELLGSELLQRVISRLPWVCGLMVVVWLGSLMLAFRSVVDVVLAIASVFSGILLLIAWMAVVGWRWNLMNLMALPLLLGAGTDYAIHFQLALRREGGDLATVHRGTGRAVWLCVATTVAGFGSLALSSNQGLASLGAVSAVGLVSIYLVSAHLLPAWWRTVHRTLPGRPGGRAPEGTTGPRGPSALYGARAWRLATRGAGVLPRRWASESAALFCLGYAILSPARRRVVARNLIPVLGGNVPAARRCAWRTFAAFGRKLADLWRYESGRSIDSLFVEFTGWNHFEAASASGRGVLLLTPHLGNWEFGAPLLASRGVNLVVVTLPEPGAGFTEIRKAARLRWGIETVVLDPGSFAFVEVIRRLQDGATVALLIDRPLPSSAVTAEFFGRPFETSVVGPELARASGCVLLPVVLPAVGDRYAAHILSAIPYERSALRNREARQTLAQDILRAFEPWLRQYPEQWFHFVPLWRAPVDEPRS